MGSALLPSPFRGAKNSGSVRYAVIGSRSFRFPSHHHRGSCPWALHKKSWAVIDRPYSLGCATVGALYERPRCIFCAKPCPWLVLRLKIALTNSPPRRGGVARSAG